MQTSQIRGIADTVVGQTIAAAATSALNTSLTEQYLDNIYIGFNTTGEQFRTVAKAAGDLSDGTDELADGIDQTADGADKLADGLSQLDDGADQLSDGAGQLSTGSEQLSTGLDKLADGTAQLPTQTRKLANGVGDTADGADELADGAEQLSSGLSEFARGTRANARGNRGVRGRSRESSAGDSPSTPRASSGLNSGLKQYERSISALAENGLPAVSAADSGAGLPGLPRGIQGRRRGGRYRPEPAVRQDGPARRGREAGGQLRDDRERRQRTGRWCRQAQRRGQEARHRSAETGRRRQGSLRRNG